MNAIDVTVVAYTVLRPDAFRQMYRGSSVREADLLAEAAGRQCYESFHKPNSRTRSNKDYLANILAQQHESVLEHASVSFLVSGVSRNLLLELERHRHLSFSVVSQRYVDSAHAKFAYPPAFGVSKDPCTHGLADYVTTVAQDRYVALVEVLTERGFTRKQAREAARSVLPGGTETTFIVTGNLRAWRDVLRKRWHVAADAEIRDLAGRILELLRVVAPNSFQDFPEVPFS